MSNDTERSNSIDEMVRQVLSITVDQLKEYTRAKNCMRGCSACGSSKWIFPIIKGAPAIYTTPSVRHSETNEWSFHLSCGQCGNTRHINAGAVWEHLFEVEDRIYE